MHKHQAYRAGRGTLVLLHYLYFLPFIYTADLDFQQALNRPAFCDKIH